MGNFKNSIRACLNNCLRNSRNRVQPQNTTPVVEQENTDLDNTMALINQTMVQPDLPEINNISECTSISEHTLDNSMVDIGGDTSDQESENTDTLPKTSIERHLPIGTDMDKSTDSTESESDISENDTIPKSIIIDQVINVAVDEPDPNPENVNPRLQEFRNQHGIADLDPILPVPNNTTDISPEIDINFIPIEEEDNSPKFNTNFISIEEEDNK